jgi:uncharacterized protein involved in tolerance to divalent cations
MPRQFVKMLFYTRSLCHLRTAPQIVKILITGGLPDYLNWINDETK